VIDVAAAEKRAAILHFIRSNPGATLKTILIASRCGHGTTQHHIGVLLRRGDIHSERAGPYVRYCGCGTPGTRCESRLLERHPLYETTKAFVGRHPGLTQADIARGLGLHDATASRALRRLWRGGLLDRFADGRARRYYPVGMAPKQVPTSAPKWEPDRAPLEGASENKTQGA
jgi:predicted transcriptional regulator